MKLINVKNKVYYKICILISAIMLLFTSCYYDNSEELYGNIPCKSGTISYANDIVPILNTSCNICHSIANAPTSGNSIVLENYSNLTNYLNNNQSTFIGSIEHSGGGSAMPKNGTKLDKCTIESLKNWIVQGKLNN